MNAIRNLVEDMRLASLASTGSYDMALVTIQKAVENISRDGSAASEADLATVGRTIATAMKAEARMVVEKHQQTHPKHDGKRAEKETGVKSVRNAASVIEKGLLGGVDPRSYPNWSQFAKGVKDATKAEESEKAKAKRLMLEAFEELYEVDSDGAIEAACETATVFATRLARLLEGYKVDLDIMLNGKKGTVETEKAA